MSVSKIVEKTESEVQWANVTVNDLTVFGDLKVSGSITSSLVAQIPVQTVANSYPNATTFSILAPTPSIPLTYINDPDSNFDINDFPSGRLIFNKIGKYKVTVSLGGCVSSGIPSNSFGIYSIVANLHEQFNGVNQTYQSLTLSQPIFSAISFATAPPVLVTSPNNFSMLHEFIFDVTSDITQTFSPYIQFLINCPSVGGIVDLTTVTPFGGSPLVNNLQVIKL